MSQEDVLRLINALIAGGETTEFAWSSARAQYSEDEVTAAEEFLRVKRAEILDLPEPLVVQRPEVIEPWWVPLPSHFIWTATRSALLDDGFPPSAMEDEVLPSATRILNHMPPPGTPDLKSRGLVLGFVQSGKTTSYSMLAAMAADAGYRLVVVLSGIHDALRQQTQDRLDRHVVQAGGSRWMNLTHDGDFANPMPLAQALNPPGSRALAVVKKNPHRLRRLVRWLDDAPDILLERVPILIIDDEADQASINVGTGRRSTINRLILDLLRRPKAAYVAFTATPFANMLIDPQDDDLYPEDFIAALPQPQDYFGPEVLFGRQPLSEEDTATDLDGLGLVRHVDDHDASQVRPPRSRRDRTSWTPSVPDSLREAIIWFVLATAIRRGRGDRSHSSMLIHTTMYTDAHNAVADAVRREVADLCEGCIQGDKVTQERVATVWNVLHRPDLAVRFGLTDLALDEVRKHLPDVLRDVRVVVDNYTSTDRLVYPDDSDVCVIAVGGNTLSRGLTLEGLVASYFVRAASAYDTLMQMGRWFGFRRGYADLPRVWMTPDLEDYFIRLATVEAEIRADVERYRLEHKTPREFAVRIRTTPGLAVTNRAKMRGGRTIQVSYAGQRRQTFLFQHRDADTLAANLGAARSLVEKARSAGAEFRRRQNREGWWLARDVPWELVSSFLSSYAFHPEQPDLNADAMVRFVEKQIVLGGITSWNVAVAGISSDENGTIDLGLPEKAHLLIRSRMNIAGILHANIKSLMSTEDRAVDLVDRDSDVKRIMQEPSTRDSRREAKLAGLRPEGVGLVVLYPIQAKSEPRRVLRNGTDGGKGKERIALDAADDVLGVGIVFPPCSRTDHEAVEYMVAFEEPLDIEDADEIAEEEAQLADAQDAAALAQEDEASEADA